MINRKKIVIMAKMAIYDKLHGEADREVFSYFRRDYIYRKNMWTRLCVALGSGFLLGLYWLHQIFIYGIDIHALDIEQSVTDSVLFLIAVMALYTMIGTIQGTHQYHLVQKRMERYMAMMKRLESLPDSEVKKPEIQLMDEDEHYEDERSLVYNREPERRTERARIEPIPDQRGTDQKN